MKTNLNSMNTGCKFSTSLTYSCTTVDPVWALPSALPFWSGCICVFIPALLKLEEKDDGGRERKSGTFLVVQWLRLLSQCRGPGFNSQLANWSPYTTTKSSHATIKDPACGSKDLFQPKK